MIYYSNEEFTSELQGNLEYILVADKKMTETQNKNIVKNQNHPFGSG